MHVTLNTMNDAVCLIICTNSLLCPLVCRLCDTVPRNQCEQLLTLTKP